MSKKELPLVVSGGARLKIDEDTGKPYWSLWGEGWKDGEDMDPGEPQVLSPDAFPPGTIIEVHEPDPDDPRSQKFYGDLIEKQATTK